jgi:hypothetical protein
VTQKKKEDRPAAQKKAVEKAKSSAAMKRVKTPPLGWKC